MAHSAISRLGRRERAPGQARPDALVGALFRLLSVGMGFCIVGAPLTMG